MTVRHDAENLIVEPNLTGTSWKLIGIHIHVSDELLDSEDSSPMWSVTKTGNPKVGHFIF